MIDDSATSPRRASSRLLGDDELAGVVANHFLDAFRSAPEGPEGEATAERAAVALRDAAERSVALHANAAALGFIEQALVVTRQPADRAGLMVLAIDPAWGLGRQDLGERYAREAIDWFTSAGDRVQARRAIAILSAMLVHLDRSEAIRSLVEPILDEPDFEADPSAPRLLNELARAYMLEEQPAQALALLERGLTIAEGQVLEHDIAELFATKAWTVAIVDRHFEAVMLAEGSIRIAERIGASLTESRARLNLSDFLMAQEPARSYEVATKGVQLSLRIGHAERAGALAGNQGYAALLIGAWETPVADTLGIRQLEGALSLVPAGDPRTGPGGRRPSAGRSIPPS